MSNTATIKVALKIDDQGVVRGFRDITTASEDAGNKSSKAFNSMGASGKATTAMLKQMSVVAAGLALGIGIAVKHSIDAVAEIDRLATMAGVSAEAFQELEYAAGQYQITQDALTDGLKELSLRGDEFAVTGAGSAKESFERLGYSATDLNKLLDDTPALLSDIIARMEGLDKASQIRIADELFGGQGGEQFVKMIQGGADAFDDMRKAAHDLGVVIDDDMVKQSADAKKKVEELTSVISAQFNTAVAEIAPDIITLTTNMLDWIKANKTLIGQGISGVAREIGSGFEFASRAATKTVDAFEKLIEIYNKFPDSLLTRILKSQTAGLDETRNFLKSMGLVDATVTKAINKDTPGYEHYASGFADKSSSGRSGSTLANKEATEKLASQQAAAWQSAYSSMDTITQAVYDKMLEYAHQEYEENIKLLGDKETAQALYAQRIKELNKKLTGSDADENIEAINRQIDALQLQADTLGMTASQAELYKLGIQGAEREQLALAKSLYETIEAAEKHAQIMDEGKQVTANMRTEAEKLGDELDRLYKMLKIGAIDQETYDRAVTQQASVGFTPAPGAGYSGDEASALNAQSQELESWYAQQMELLEQYRQERSDLNAMWDEREAQIKQQHEDRLNNIEQSRYKLAFSSASSMFGSMSELASVYAGEQSDTYRALFAVSKAFAIAQASIDLWQAIANAGASTTWPANLAAMASVAAAMGGLVSNIAAIGMAHEGIDSVPKSGTWLLEKGERVTTESTSKRLDTVLTDIQSRLANGAGTGVGTVVQSNPKIVNVWDESMISDHISSGRADAVIINRIKKNASTIKNFLN